MGEVYRARDTRLDRDVALKVLPAHLRGNSQLRKRFEREARAASNLNHPHICTLHDIGNQDGIDYLVMELLEGETLEQRLKKGPLPHEEALRLAVTIGDALDRAHRAGIAHRDVKPGNIMLTRDGPKVLDFGLAKSMAKTGSSEETQLQLSMEGTVLGTPQYMAPEVIEGNEGGTRADIWAFGAVLYEMVTARKPFDGKSQSSLMGTILAADPPPLNMKPVTPAWLERLVRRCLAKDPEHRYQSMRDVVLELEEPPRETRAPVRRNWWPWVAAFSLLAVGGAWQFRLAMGKQTIAPVAMEIIPPQGGSFVEFSMNLGGSAISPDGSMLAFGAVTAKGAPLLHIRELHSLQARAIGGTDGAETPFWSPDSKSVAYRRR
jgi:serine/threonine protein kinase